MCEAAAAGESSGWTVIALMSQWSEPFHACCAHHVGVNPVVASQVRALGTQLELGGSPSPDHLWEELGPLQQAPAAWTLVAPGSGSGWSPPPKVCGKRWLVPLESYRAGSGLQLSLTSIRGTQPCEVGTATISVYMWGTQAPRLCNGSEPSPGSKPSPPGPAPPKPRPVFALQERPLPPPAGRCCPAQQGGSGPSL